MRSGREFLRRNTGLAPAWRANSHLVVEAKPLAKDLVWYPLLAAVIAILLAGFFYPLAMIALPVELAALLTICWQGALTGFRTESAMLSADYTSKPTGQGASNAVFFLLLLIKLSAMRQMFPEEAARAFLFCGATTYCLPPLAVRVLSHGTQVDQDAPATRFSTGIGIGLWLTTVLLLSAPELFSGAFHPSELRLPLVVTAASLFAWMLCLDSRRRLHGDTQIPWNSEMFAGSLAAECGGLVALLAVRNMLL